jgi:transposase
LKRVVKNNRQPSGRKQGGQPGHQGKTLRFSAAPDHIVKVNFASSCSCGFPLDQVKVEKWRRQQCYDLPGELKLEVTEYQVPRLHCPACGKLHQGKAPFEAAVSYGPRIRSLVTYLNQYQLLPYERIQELFRDLFGHSVSDGFLQSCNQCHYEALADSEQQIKESLRQSEQIGADETSSRCMSRNYWIHTAGNQTFTYYHADEKRGSEAIKRAGVLPDYQGIVTHDRYGSYDRFAFTHALCGAHLLRDLKFLYEERNCKWAKKLYKLMLWAKEYKESRELTFKDRLEIDRQYDMIVGLADLAEPKPPSGKKTKTGRPKRSEERKLLDVFLKRKQDVLRFLYHEHVPFDNNLSERDLRMIKLQQKISGGFRSVDGLKVFCRIRSYIASVKKHGYQLFNVLVKALNGQPYFSY